MKESFDSPNHNARDADDSGRLEPSGAVDAATPAGANINVNAAANTNANANAEANVAVNTQTLLLERLVQATLDEKKAARRSRLISRWLWLGFFALMLWGLFGKGCTNKTGIASDVPHTAMVEIKGEIDADAQANARDIVDAMQSAFESPNAKAVVLLINSPGGSPVQAGIINDEIKQLKLKYKKPVYAVVEESCTSAAYYIAVAADKIFADKASLVGSIGVLMDGFGFTGTMEKLGVERRLMTAGENKGFLDPFSPQSSAHKAYAQSMLNQIHQQFIDVVKTGRGERLKASPEIFSGLFWSGQQALDLGLIDDLRTLDAVARDVVQAQEVVDYTFHENVAEKLVKRLGASIGEGVVMTLRSAPRVN